MTLALALAVALVVACVVLVALPFLREPDPESDVLDELDPAERRRLELLEERDRALAALKELEFDHRTGTVSDEDYRAQVGVLRREAAAALKALDGRDEGASAVAGPVGPEAPMGAAGGPGARAEREAELARVSPSSQPVTRGEGGPIEEARSTESAADPGR